MALIDKLKAIAETIRGKTGGTEELTLDQMAQEIESIETGGSGQWTTDGIADHSEPNGDIHVNRAEIVSYAFYRKPIESVCGDDVSQIGEGAFGYCESLKSIDFKNAESIESQCFRECLSLESINMPNLRTGAIHMFNGCSSIKEVLLPEFTGPLYHGFDGCTKLEELYLPKLELIQNNGVSNCTALRIFDAGYITSLSGWNILNGTKSLEVLILRSEAIVSLNIANGIITNSALNVDGAGVTIYVPEKLITEYEQATNWCDRFAAGSCVFLALEGSEYE